MTDPSGGSSSTSSSGQAGIKSGSISSSSSSGELHARLKEQTRHERAQIRALFELYDVNKDGTLDEDDVKHALDKLRLPHSLIHPELSMNKRVSFDEFRRIVRSEEHKLIAAFEQYDTDGSGYIEQNELVVALNKYANWNVSPEQAAALLARLDYDHDGRLSYSEFRKMLILLGDPDVRKIALFWARLSGVDDGGDIPPMLPPPNPPLAVRAGGPAATATQAATATATTNATSANTAAATTTAQPDWLTTSKQFVAGGLAGAISRSVVSPLERLKIMFMCGDAKTRSLGMAGALRKIWAEDGVKGFFRGNGANMARIFPFSAIQLTVYPYYKSLMVDADGKLPMTHLFVSGVMAGVTATACTYPLDFIRSRLSIQDASHQVYKGIWDGLRTVVKNEGVRTLYTGLNATLIGIVPYAGIQLSVYDKCKQYAASRHADGKPQQLDFFLSGAFAGASAQTVAFPIECIRRRMQTQGFNTTVTEAERYKGFLDAFGKVIRQEGVTGLYRGLLPNYLKIVPAAGVSFLAFEQLKKVFGVSGGSAL